MHINRAIKDDIIHRLQSHDKIVLVYGPRQVGKTTLVKRVIDELDMRSLRVNADEEKYTNILSSRDSHKIRSLVSGYDLLFIDEAQRIPDIGINLKIIKDEIPELRVIVTGSSSFELANRVSEPLTGRTWTYYLYPIAMHELRGMYTDIELQDMLSNTLVFGMYPDIQTAENLQDKAQLLSEIGRSYLYKDVLQMADIKYADKLKKLLKLLAFQVGSEVSLSELARILEINKDTVRNYIDILEKSFIIFRVSAFNRNLRKEVSKMDKIYFYDLGIRNFVIDNLKPLDERNDIGALWENFLFIERKKLLAYKRELASQYFWRLSTGAELDYVEESGGVLLGCEFKYARDRVRPPQSWLDTYENSDFKLINKDNYLDFIS